MLYNKYYCNNNDMRQICAHPNRKCFRNLVRYILYINLCLILHINSGNNNHNEMNNNDIYYMGDFKIYIVWCGVSGIFMAIAIPKGMYQTHAHIQTQ